MKTSKAWTFAAPAFKKNYNLIVIIYLLAMVASLLHRSRSWGDSLSCLGPSSSPEDYLTSGRGASHCGSFPTLPPPHPQTSAHEKPLLQGKQLWITRLWMGGGSKCKLRGQRVFDKNSSTWAKSDIYTWTRCWYQGSVWKMLTARDAAL